MCSRLDDANVDVAVSVDVAVAVDVDVTVAVGMRLAAAAVVLRRGEGGEGSVEYNHSLFPSVPPDGGRKGTEP